MSAFYINANGVEHVTTTVTIPRELHAWARESGVSLSGTLRVALRSKQKGYERGRDAPTPTSPAAPARPHLRGEPE